MNFDFEKSFLTKGDKVSIPQELLDELNKDLPDNMEYHYDEQNHILFAESIDGGDIKIEGLLFNLNETQKKILGEKHNYRDIFTLIDNAQELIEVIPANKDNTVIINGKKVPLKKLVLRLSKGLIIEEVDNTVYAFGNNEQTMDLELSNDNYKKKIVLKRIAVKSLDYMCLESDDKSALRVSLKADLPVKLGNPVHITINLNPERAASVRDLVEAISIYNSFVDPDKNDGYVDGVQSHLNTDSDTKVFDPYAELFWNKVFAIEEYTSSTFMVPVGNIENDLIYTVDELYYSLVHKKPIRKSYRFNSLTGNWDEAELQKQLAGLNGHKIGVVFAEVETIDDFFGVPFSFVRAKCGLNIQLTDYKIEKGQGHLIIDKDNDNSYVVELLFKDEEEYSSFESSHNMLNYVKDADSLAVIVENDDKLLP